ncbi:MAG: hypothetical protein IOC66_08005 [Burkholderia sp.]|nr:hypothetical protein [Burkholderia sp.]
MSNSSAPCLIAINSSAVEQAPIEPSMSSQPSPLPGIAHDLLYVTSAYSSSVMPRSSIIPSGSWPRRMPAAIAAGYCGESSVEAFLKRVGIEYPQPRIKEGRRQLWLRDDLDRAIAPDLVPGDLAEDL